jgi:hypothetical protein
MINKLKTELVRVDFIKNAFIFLENNYIPKQFGDAFENNESLNEFYRLEEPSQVGVQLTAQISHAFYSYLKYHLNHLFEKENSFLRVVTIREVNNTKSYDLVLEDLQENKLHYIEVKLSQNKNSWQGSTSTTSKVDMFLLINFKIDRNLKLNSNNKKIFTGIFASIVDMKNKNWEGEAKSNNHRTKFEFRKDFWDIDFLSKECIIMGGVSPKKSILHLVHNDIHE